MKLPSDTFHDVITATWKKAKGTLTSKQKRWGRAFLSLGNPSDAQVARKLGISRTASSKMKWRILEKLRPFYTQYLNDKGNDETLLKVAIDKQERILKKPEYLEKRRGQVYFVHWKAKETYNRRLGVTSFSGYSGRQIKPKEFENLKNLPIEKRTTHKASPLSVWWRDTIWNTLHKKSSNTRKLTKNFLNYILKNGQKALLRRIGYAVSAGVSYRLVKPSPEVKWEKSLSAENIALISAKLSSKDIAKFLYPQNLSHKSPIYLKLYLFFLYSHFFTCSHSPISRGIKKENNRGFFMISDNEILKPKEAAKLLRRNPQTLANWRWRGKGPDYILDGNRPLYLRKDINRWLAKHRVKLELKVKGESDSI